MNNRLTAGADADALSRCFWGLLIGLGVGLSQLAHGETSHPPTPGKPGLPSFPKPSPAQAFSELKIYDASGSPIRVPVEDWGGAKQRLASDASWREWADKSRERLDAWIGTQCDKVGWIAGWHHNFVSPKDGSFLTFTPIEPGKETLSSPSDPKVKLTPELHAAWVYEFRSRHASMMVEAARMFRLTGDARYAKWAACQLDFYTDNYHCWATRKDAHFMFQSLDEAVTLIKWVSTARLLGDYVPPAQKKCWSEKLFRPEAALLRNSYQSIHNIACWHRSAVGVVAIYCNDNDLWRAAVEGKNGLRDQVARGITSDYLWFEQSLGYNGYVVKALLPFFESALQAGRGAELRPEMEVVENLLLAPLALRFPNGQLPYPADGGKARRLAAVLLTDTAAGVATEDSYQLAAAARIFPTLPGLKLRQSLRDKNWDLLLDPPPTARATAALPPVTSLNLESSRMAIIRSGAWQAYFHYGQLASSHAQAEALNFEAFYNDTDITHDPGTTGYGSKFTTEYFRSGACHNVPLVDGLGQASWHPGQLESFNETNVVASQPAYRPNAQARRSLTIVGAQLLDQVSLTTTDGREHQLGFVLHLQGRVKLPGTFQTAANFTQKHPATSFKYWQNVRSLTGRDQISLTVDYTGTPMQVELKLAGPWTLYHATAPDYPPTKREVLFIETQGASAELTTIFQPCSGAK